MRFHLRLFRILLTRTQVTKFRTHGAICMSREIVQGRLLLFNVFDRFKGLSGCRVGRLLFFTAAGPYGSLAEIGDVASSFQIPFSLVKKSSLGFSGEEGSGDETVPSSSEPSILSLKEC